MMPSTFPHNPTYTCTREFVHGWKEIGRSLSLQYGLRRTFGPVSVDCTPEYVSWKWTVFHSSENLWKWQIWRNVSFPEKSEKQKNEEKKEKEKIRNIRKKQIFKKKPKKTRKIRKNTIFFVKNKENPKKWENQEIWKIRKREKVGNLENPENPENEKIRKSGKSGKSGKWENQEIWKIWKIRKIRKSGKSGKSGKWENQEIWRIWKIGKIGKIKKNMLNNLKISGKEKNIRKIRKTIEKTENQKQKTNVFSVFSISRIYGKCRFFTFLRKGSHRPETYNLKVWRWSRCQGLVSLRGPDLVWRKSELQNRSRRCCTRVAVSSGNPRHFHLSI